MCGRVTDQLFVGGELGPRDWEALAKEGVSVVVNLQQEQQDYFRDDERVESYLWLPAPDQLAPTVEQLALGVHFIRAAIAADKRVFVHCKAGQGRAPLLCACYLVSLGDSPMEAMTKVRDARPSTMLTPEQGVRLREFTSARDEAIAASQSTPVPTLNGAPDSTEPKTTPEIAATVDDVAAEVEAIDENIENAEAENATETAEENGAGVLQPQEPAATQTP